MKILFCLIICAHAVAIAASPALETLRHKTLANKNPELTLSKFAFGSCWKAKRSQEHWQPIIAKQPQFWLWLGDNIYADTTDMARMREKYQRLADTPGYRQLAGLYPVLATWDDHDYGKNDAGIDYAMRAESQKVFLEFFNERADSPRWQRPGIYTSYSFGQGDKRVQLILLDTRYFRTPLTRIDGKPPYRRMGKWAQNSSPQATILGESQWQWLESELSKPARVRIIASSIQFAAPHNGYETWANIPAEKQRMIDLIIKTRAEGVVFLSGDIHSSELCLQESQGCYPLIDFTSSSLNVPLGAAATHRRMGPAYGGANFGLVEIDWSGDEPSIRFSTKDTNNQTRLYHSVRLSSLTFSEKNLTSSNSSIATSNFAGEWQTFYGPLTLTQLGHGRWSGQRGDRTLALQQSQSRLIGTWQQPQEGQEEGHSSVKGKVIFTLSRDGRFLQGAHSHGELPLQLDWAGWKADWQKHFQHRDPH